MNRTALSVALALALGSVGAPVSAATPPPAPPCEVTNTRTTTMVGSLATAVSAATAGDTLEVSGVCRNVAVTIDRDLTLVGVRSGSYLRGVLTGRGKDSVLRIASGKTVRLELLRISGGRGTNRNSGGGITNAGTLTLDRTTVRRNVAIFGGGIQTTGPVTLIDSVVAGNLATDFGGGLAVNAAGSVALQGASELRSNTATNGAGAWVAGSISLADDVTVFYNRAYRRADSPWQTNYPFAGYGGAIFLEGSISITGSAYITLNEAQSRAGAIYWSNLNIISAYCDSPFTELNPTKNGGGDMCIKGTAKS